jgi:hypothetical protein
MARDVQGDAKDGERMIISRGGQNQEFTKVVLLPS